MATPSDPRPPETEVEHESYPNAAQQSSTVPPGEDDIPMERVIRLGDYLRDLTEGDFDITQKNYTIIEPQTWTGEGKLLYDEGTGNPAALDDPLNPTDSLQETYIGIMKNLLNDAANEFANIGAPGAIDTRGGGSGLNVGLNKNNQSSGHTLLASIAGTDSPQPVIPGQNYQDQLSAVLSHNRFADNSWLEEVQVKKNKDRLIQDRAQSRDVCAAIADVYVPRSDENILLSDGLGNNLNVARTKIDNANARVPTADDIGRLGNLGRSLMLIASGDGYSGGTDEPYDPSSSEVQNNHASNNAAAQGDMLGAALKAIINSPPGMSFGDGTVPTGLDKIPVDKLRAEYAWGPDSGIDDKLKDLHGIASDDKEAHSSYGQLNNYLEPFGGALPGSMYTLAINNFLMIFAMSILWTVIIDVLVIAGVLFGGQLIPTLSSMRRNTAAAQSGAQTVGNDANRPQTLKMGRRRGYAGKKSGKPDVKDGTDPTSILGEVANLDIVGMILHYLGINIPFNYLNGMKGPWFILPYTRATMTGFLQFFLNIALDPMAGGYFANLTRNVMRDAAEVRLRKDADSSDGLTGAFAALERLRDSGIVRFISTMADLGEIAAVGGFYGRYMFSAAKMPVSNLPDDPRTRVVKPRRNDGVQSTATGMLPSLYLLPRAMHRAATQAGMIAADGLDGTHFDEWGSNFISNNAISDYHNTYLSGISETSAVVTKVGHRTVDDVEVEGNRFSPDDVKHIENMLEAEYLPFYFQDVRTNEIIAFHAFLTSLSDAYAPTFSATSGFGRIDPARVYEKTERSISVNFFVYAANPNDLDEMYAKINKLVTMVYPQWSRGTELATTKDERFIQPFSQVPTATPLLRMRVGDLLRSNFSLHNFNRLQGLGEEALGDAAFQASVKSALEAGIDTGKLPAYKNAIAKAPVLTAGIPSDGFGFPIGSAVRWKPGGNAEMEARSMIFTAGIGVDLGLEPKTAQLKQVMTAPNAVMGYDDEDPETGQATTVWVALAAENLAGNGSAAGYCVKVPYANLITMPGYNTYNADLVGVIPLPGVPQSSASSFPDPAAASADGDAGGLTSLMGRGNPIYKAFEQGMGRGLAGVITSLNFDWKIADGLWDTTPGNRGPMQCEVQINFAPIHDITPGIDHNGFNRAPVYGIGESNSAMQGDPWNSNAEFKSDILPAIQVGNPITGDSDDKSG